MGWSGIIYLAPVGGTIIEINFSSGQVVEAGDLVAVIEY